VPQASAVRDRAARAPRGDGPEAVRRPCPSHTASFKI